MYHLRNLKASRPLQSNPNHGMSFVLFGNLVDADRSLFDPLPYTRLSNALSKAKIFILICKQNPNSALRKVTNIVFGCWIFSKNKTIGTFILN